MNNYQYIIGSLPFLTKDYKFDKDTNASTIYDFILFNCSNKDKQLVHSLLNGFDEHNLDANFYTSTLGSKNLFIKSYYALDLFIRNTKVEYLNKTLGRPQGTDIVDIFAQNNNEEFRSSYDILLQKQEFNKLINTLPTEQVKNIFKETDLLSREKKIDDLMWQYIDGLIVLKYFDIDVILGFIAKMHIVSRWLKLDEQKGRELFRTLVNQIRGSFNVNDVVDKTF